MSDKRTLLIIGAAEEHYLGVLAALDLGLDVVLADGNPHAYCFERLHGLPRLDVSTYDHVGMLEAARAYIAQGGRIDGVWTLASDVPYTVAYVAENLGLSGIGVEAARNVSNKVVMKERLKAGKVPLPRYHYVPSISELRRVAYQMDFPVVVKPLDNRGARGVRLVREAYELSAALLDARSHNLNGGANVLVEQYLPGPQLSVEGVMLNHKAYIPAIFDRNYARLDEFYPYIVEDGGEMPSIYAALYREEIIDVMERAGQALGIINGPIKGDLVIHGDRVRVIEIAGRLSGGFFATVAIPTSTGVDLLKMGIKLALGDKVYPEELDRTRDLGAAIRFAFPPQGKLKKVGGWSDVYYDDSCEYAGLFVGSGDEIKPYTCHPARPAVVVASGSDVFQARDRARALINKLEWEVE